MTDFYTYGFEPEAGKAGNPVQGILFTGRFIEKQDKDGIWFRYFRNCMEKDIEIERVMYLQPTFNQTGGIKRVPQAFRLDSSGNVIRDGDIVAYTTIFNSPTDYLILGAVQHARQEQEELDTDYTDPENCEQVKEIRENKYRRFEYNDDAKGAMYVSFTTKDGEEKAVVNFETNGILRVVVHNDEGEMLSEINLDRESETVNVKDKHSNTVQMNENGIVIETEKIKIGKMLSLINQLFDAIKLMTLKTNTGATIPEPINWSQFQQVRDEFNTFMEIELKENE